MLDWLYSNNAYYTPEVSVVAANRGYLKILKWLYVHNYKISPKTHREACFRKDYQMLEWLLEQNIIRDKRVIRHAYQKKDMLMLKWLIAHDYKYDDKFPSAVASDPQWDLIDILLEAEYLSPKICEQAAQKQNYQLLQLLMGNGYPLTPKAIKIIAANGDWDIFRA